MGPCAEKAQETKMGEFEKAAKAAGLSDEMVERLFANSAEVAVEAAVKFGEHTRTLTEMMNKAFVRMLLDMTSELSDELIANVIFTLASKPVADDPEETVEIDAVSDIKPVRSKRGSGFGRGRNVALSDLLYSKLGAVVATGPNKTLAIREGMMKFAFEKTVNGASLSNNEIRSWAIIDLGLSPELANRVALAMSNFLRSAVGFNRVRGRKPKNGNGRAVIRLVAPSTLPFGFPNEDVEAIASQYGVYKS
jgi:hypothetical protein